MTLELLLIFTIFVIAVVVAFAALRDRIEASDVVLGPVWVTDSAMPDPLVVGKVLDLDAAGAARVLRRDPENGASVPLGVRADRFTSRAPVYYALDDCTGTPYLAGPLVRSLPRVAAYHELQGLSYGVGAGGTGLLYRDDGVTAPCVGIACPNVASVWISGWTWDDSQAAGALPPSASLPTELNPCRDLADGPIEGLVPAVEVLDPDTGLNALASFVAPFRLR